MKENYSYYDIQPPPQQTGLHGNITAMRGSVFSLHIYVLKGEMLAVCL